MKNIIKLKLTSLYNNVHFLFIFAIILIITLSYWYFVFILLAYTIFLIKKTGLFIYILLILIIISISNLQYQEKDIKDEFDCLIVDKENNKYKVLVNGYYLYLYINGEVEIGDRLHVKTREFIASKPSPFDYNTYLKRQNIFAIRSVTKYEVLGHIFVLSSIKKRIINLIPESEVKEYITSFLLGERENSELTDKANQLGISHLFAISGLHITFLIMMLSFLLDRLFYFTKYKEIIKIIFLFFYMMITNFPISLTRASLLIILPIIFKKALFTKLDYLSIIGIIYLLIHPSYLFLPSFYFSFLMSFIMIVYMKKEDNKMVNVIKTSALCFVLSIPLVINNNYQINMLTLLISPIYLVFFEFILFPLTIILLFLPFLIPYLSFVYEFFSSSIDYFSSIDYLNLIFGHLEIIEISVMYLFLFLIMYKQNYLKLAYLVLFIIFMFGIYFRPIIRKGIMVSMYNVGQGDSILISVLSENINILVDAYGNIDDYLRYDGIKRIDYLFLTHGDDDHIEAFETIYQLYKPKTYTTMYTKKEKLLDYTIKYKILQIKEGFSIENKVFSLLTLGPIRSLSEENNNSLVMKITYQNFSILLTGDMEIEEEKMIIEKYHNKLQSMVLKVGHHGADNASSKELLQAVKPDICLISVLKNNKYNHPNNEYLLANYNVYRTDLLGSIYLSYFNDKLVWKNGHF